MTGKAKILVVEDEQNTLSATVRTLKSAGYDVLETLTGGDCLRAVRKDHSDLDWMSYLPIWNGSRFATRLKQKAGLEGTFVVLVSAEETSSDDQAKRLDTDADGYIVRPITNRETIGAGASLCMHQDCSNRASGKRGTLP